MSEIQPSLPGYWRFAWMFFMQPVSLRRRLEESGLTVLGNSGWYYWRMRNELDIAYGYYLRHLGFLLLMPVLVVSFVSLYSRFTVPITVNSVINLVIAAFAYGAFIMNKPESSAAFGVPMAILLLIASSVEYSLVDSSGFVTDWALNSLGVDKNFVAAITLMGLIFGVERGVVPKLLGKVSSGGLARESNSRFVFLVMLIFVIMAACLAGALAGVLVGALFGGMMGLLIAFPGVSMNPDFSMSMPFSMKDGAVYGLVCGAAGGIAYALSRLRIPIYPLESLIQWGLYLARGQDPTRTLRFSPVLLHELSYLSLPFLARHTVAVADDAPDLAARVLEACRIAPGQRRVGERALSELQARELAVLARQRRFLAAMELQGRWLPGRDTDSPLLRALTDAARFLAAAQGSSSPYLARQHLDTAEQKLQAIDNLLLASKEPLSRFLPDTLAAWQSVLGEMGAENRQAAAEVLPNPFIAWNPLSGEQPSAKDLFRGREATLRQVETLLAGNQASLALIGPRRSGKSSLLNMFRVMLPDTQVVLFDLQDNPASTPESFYRVLVDQARKQAYQDHRLSLPAFPDGAPIEALRTWLDTLEHHPGVDRFLICIDEFERLPDLFPGKGGDLVSSDGLFVIPDMRPSQGRDMLQFMGLLRATIQHRRRVRLLVAGSAPFDELDPLWSDHFINLREIRIGYLDEPTCVELLTQPVREFPLTAIPAEVARAVVARTGGQPFLVQLYGALLVDRLNEVKRRTATPDDLEPVEEDVLKQANYYFTNVWGDLSPAAQSVLRALVLGESAQADAATQHWLRRRLVLSEAGTLLVPVFGRWIRNNVFEV